MPRLVNRPPAYRKHPTGQAIVSIGGRMVYLGRYGSADSWAKYHRVLGEAAINGGRPPVAKSDVTVSELIEAYRPFAESNHPKNIDGIRQACRYLRQHYGSTKAESFGPLAFQAVIAKMVADGKSRSYVNDHVGRIKRLFRWAVVREMIPVGTLSALLVVGGERKGKSLARDTEPVGPVDDATVDATLPHLPPVVADMVSVHRLIGCRPGELCRMKPGDVDRSGDVWAWKLAEHKTAHRGHGRRVAIGPKAQAILAKYLDGRDPDAFCFAPAESERQRRLRLAAERQTPLSQGNSPGTNRKRRPKCKAGRRYTEASYRRAITRGCELAFGLPAELVKPSDEYLKARKVNRRKIPEPLAAAEAKRRVDASAWRKVRVWSPNQLRHSFGTKARQWGGLEAAQVSLGHSNAKVTEVYAERDAALADKVALAIG